MAELSSVWLMRKSWKIEEIWVCLIDQKVWENWRDLRFLRRQMVCIYERRLIQLSAVFNQKKQSSLGISFFLSWIVWNEALISSVCLFIVFFSSVICGACKACNEPFVSGGFNTSLQWGSYLFWIMFCISSLFEVPFRCVSFSEITYFRK